jgi:cytochrome c553
MSMITSVIVVAMLATITAQVRPTPQPPPRRTAPPPRQAPPPKRGESQPDEDRGNKGAAPQQPASAPQQGPAPPSAAADATPAGIGAALYKKNGCYECHVNDAQGGPQGPRLGPNPIPFARFQAYVRNPTGDMPPFTAKVISDQDLQSIYAFVQSRPTPPPVKDIPLLAP